MPVPGGRDTGTTTALSLPAMHPESSGPNSGHSPTRAPQPLPKKKRKPLYLKDFRHAPSGTRTPNLLIKSPGQEGPKYGKNQHEIWDYVGFSVSERLRYGNLQYPN